MPKLISAAFAQGSQMSGGALQRTLYRSLLRWPGKFGSGKEKLPIQLSATDVQGVLPELVPGPVPLPDRLQELQVQTLAKWAFRQSRHLQGWDAEEAIDRSVQALFILNGRYMEEVEELRQARAAHTNRQDIAFPIGTVFEHRRHGYRGVVCGWDRTCAKPEDWARGLELNPDQPFYICLPDEHSYTSRTKELRISRYTAQTCVRQHVHPECACLQENIVPVTNRRVCNRKVDVLFSGYNEAEGRYVPSARLAFEYPDEYPAATTDCSGDSNILLHEDWVYAGETATCGAEEGMRSSSHWVEQSQNHFSQALGACSSQDAGEQASQEKTVHDVGSDPCPHCGGSGQELAGGSAPSAGMADCPHCGDQQIIRDQFEWSRDKG